MTREEQIKFIKDTILAYRDDKITLGIAATAIMEGIIPKPPPTEESLKWARKVIAEYEKEKVATRQCDWCLKSFPEELLSPADCDGVRYCLKCQTYYDLHGKPPPREKQSPAGDI